jgi:hypothetical protein
MEPSQVDANLSEAITFAPALAVPKPHPQSGQQTFTQALLQHSVAQLSRHAVTWDMLSGSRTDAGATSWVANSSKSLGSKWPMKGASDPWLGIGEADAIEPRADSGLGIGGDGPMNVVGTCVTRSPGADLEDMWPQ